LKQVNTDFFSVFILGIGMSKGKCTVEFF